LEKQRLAPQPAPTPVTGLTPTQEQQEREAKFTAEQQYLQSPEGQRALELASQEARWTVVINGETKVFDTYMAAEAAVAAANTQPQTRTTVPAAVSTQPVFVDAPGMEEYVAELNIPTTGSGVKTPGFVDAKIAETSMIIHQFGSDLGASAAKAKLAGQDVAAGAMASAAIAVGVSSAVFDAYTWLLNVSPTSGVDAFNFKDDPLFKTGYIGGSLALAALAVTDLASAINRKYDVVEAYKAWRDKPTMRIMSTEEFLQSGYIGTSGPYGVDVPITYPVGSKEYNLAMKMRGSPVAYAMVDLDTPRVFLNVDELYSGAYDELLDIDYYMVDYLRDSNKLNISSLVGGIGGAKLLVSMPKVVPKEFLDIKEVIIQTSPTRVIQPTVTKVIQGPVTVSEALTKQEAQTGVVTDTLTESITEQITKQITEQIAEQITEPITEPITEQITKQITEQITEQEVIPEDVVEPTSEEPKPPWLKLPKKEKKEEKRAVGVQARRFRVVLDGRVSTVEADSFVEALSGVSGGRGHRATVTRLS